MKILSHDGFNEIDDIRPINTKNNKSICKNKEKNSSHSENFIVKIINQCKYEVKAFKELYQYIKASKAKDKKYSKVSVRKTYVGKHSSKKTGWSFKKAATPVCTVCLIGMLATLVSITKFSPMAATVSAANETSMLNLQQATEGSASSEFLENDVADLTGKNLCAYGLYVDGEFMGAAFDKQELNKALDEFLTQAVGDYDETTITKFYNDVEIKETKAGANTIFSAKELVEAAKEKFVVSLTTDYEVMVEIPYEVEYVYDDEKDTDYKEVTQKGKAGSAKTLYKLVFVNGVQTDLVYDSFEIVTEPTKEIVTVGTKEPEIVAGVSTGEFMWPVPYTTNVTSGYGSRWGTTHTGIDIADGGCYGQNIVASDGGTVEWAGYDDSGYGNYVIIDHGNGYKTLYGHCSELYVTAGQSVAQGEAIAAIGSTGDSTGPHLHFEVRQNGSRLDPAIFV